MSLKRRCPPMHVNISTRVNPAGCCCGQRRGIAVFIVPMDRGHVRPSRMFLDGLVLVDGRFFRRIFILTPFGPALAQNLHG